MTLVLRTLIILATLLVARAQLQLTQVGSGFNRPLLILDDPVANGKRKFVVEQVRAVHGVTFVGSHVCHGSLNLFILCCLLQFTSLVKIMNENGAIVGTFIDLSSKTTRDEVNEGGLLGMAFHPNYNSNRWIFVNYTTRKNGVLYTVVRRVRRSATNANRVVLGSDANEEMLVFQQPYTNHNGGQLLFGPKDGMLYISSGDGGSSGDPQNRAQQLNNPYGKILRLRPRVNTVKAGYIVPLTNPFANATNGWRKLVWHYGLRNPWRFTFDKVTGDMYIGDVGQGSFEEIDVAPHGSKALNFGWNRKEGFACFPANTIPCPIAGLRDPVLAYGRNEGSSVTGGYVYRGTAMPSLAGSYIFADFVTGAIWKASNATNPWTKTLLTDTSYFISSFGEDKAGELYIADLFGGRIFKLRTV
jgi:glucose/arabinose dehydrogenase